MPPNACQLDQLGTEILRYKYNADSRLTNRWSAEKTNTYYAMSPDDWHLRRRRTFAFEAQLT